MRPVEGEVAGAVVREPGDDRHQHGVVLPAAGGVPGAVLAVHLAHRGRHGADQRGGGERGARAERDAGAADGLAQRCRPRVHLRRVHGQRRHHLLRALEARAAEGAAQLLQAVPDEEPADDQSDDQLAEVHGHPLPKDAAERGTASTVRASG